MGGGGVRVYVVERVALTILLWASSDNWGDTIVQLAVVSWEAGSRTTYLHRWAEDCFIQTSDISSPLLEALDTCLA